MYKNSVIYHKNGNITSKYQFYFDLGGPLQESLLDDPLDLIHDLVISRLLTIINESKSIKLIFLKLFLYKKS